MGSSESLAGTPGVEQVKEEEEEEEERGKVVKAKVFKSTFAKQLEEKRAPLMRQIETEGEKCAFFGFFLVLWAACQKNRNHQIEFGHFNNF